MTAASRNLWFPLATTVSQAFSNDWFALFTLGAYKPFCTAPHSSRMGVVLGHFFALLGANDLSTGGLMIWSNFVAEAEIQTWVCSLWVLHPFRTSLKLFVFESDKTSGTGLTGYTRFFVSTQTCADNIHLWWWHMWISPFPAPPPLTVIVILVWTLNKASFCSIFDIWSVVLWTGVFLKFRLPFLLAGCAHDVRFVHALFFTPCLIVADFGCASRFVWLDVNLQSSYIRVEWTVRNDG